MKTCAGCGVTKAPGEFNKHKKSRDGLQYSCRQCTRESHAKYRSENPDLMKNAQLRAKYGITLAEYHQLLSDQGGVCWICKDPPESRRNRGHQHLSVDHNHSTGVVRGLLCHVCNQMLGLIERDGRDHLLSMDRYLSTYNKDWKN